MLFAVLLVFAGAFACPAAVAQQKHEYTFAIVPQLTPLETSRRWTPVLDTISRISGISLRLVHYRSIPIFESRLAEGAPDFAYMNPYHELQAHRQQGYIPLLRDGKKQLQGILVVRADNPARSPLDLDNTEMAFPAPNAFGASLYMRALLQRDFGIHFKSKFVHTHANVYRNVIFKTVTAGGGIWRTFRSENNNIRKLLRIIYTTPGVPAHPICAHPRVPKEVREKIVAAVLTMSKDAAMASKLKTIGMPEPVEADFDRDYAPLKELNLDKFLDSSER